jgi:signal peptidase II
MNQPPNPRLRKILIVLLFAVFLFAADYLTKQAAMRSLNPFEFKRISSFLNLVLVSNSGVAFNLLDGEGPFQGLKLTGVALLALIPLFYFFRLARATDICLLAALGVILGGAAGNIHDRLAYNAVVDFLDFHYKSRHWPAFNVADAGICVGVGLVVLVSLRDIWRNRGAKEEERSGQEPRSRRKTKKSKGKG